MALKGFTKQNAFNSSKVAVQRILSDTVGKLGIHAKGNSSKPHSLKSGTKSSDVNGKY